MELFTVLIGIIAFVAVVALLGMGLIGVFLVVLIGLVLALLFNSILIAFPLLLLVAVGWLVVEPESSH
jgi:preprotein translocase subunit SecF